MNEVLNAKEAGLLDKYAIEEFGIPSLVLMERASLALAERIREHFTVDEKILVVSGSGNNGGDGVAAGRILMEWGYDVSVFLIGEPEKASEELQRQIQIAKKCQLPFVTEPDFSRYAVLIDAVFGIGLSREVKGKYAEYITQMGKSGCRIVSVDIPSGISANTGEVLGVAVKADMTVTFGKNKMGLLLFPGALYTGKVYVEEIGFPKKALEMVAPAAFFYDKKDIGALFPKRIPDSNKGSYGKLLVIAGSEKISGATFFAAKAAYLMGCGLVKVVTHENNRAMIQEKLPEALLSFYREQKYSLENDILWASAVLIGPGLGLGKQADLLLDQVLQVKDKPVLVDADAINLLAHRSDMVHDGSVFLPDNFVLTPHVKEMSRLIRLPVDEIKRDISSKAKMTKNGAVIVLKDARTIVSDGRQLYINVTGNNALAKGGSGDALSGMIGGLLARGTAVFYAATLGVYLHGMTADEYIKDRSPSAMLASDILEMLPRILP